MANPITVAAPPLTAEVANQLLAAQAAQSGIVTDYNKGSQIRTLAEAIGSVSEISSIAALTLALQAIAYSGMSIFGIVPNGAVAANGTATFMTALNNGPPASQDISIPQGTLVQTLGGVQFQTTQATTLASGATGVTATIVAVVGGADSNVPIGAVNQLVTGLIYPLVVYNFVPTFGGADAESPTAALTRLAAKFSSLVGGSPVSVANSAIGVSALGETVRYATCYEPWADPTSSSYPNKAGFTLYVDNGSGAASAALLAAVAAKLNGNFVTNTPAYRPAGVPNSVHAVSPIYANVAVSGTLGPLSTSAVSGAIAAAVSGYFTLQFGAPAEQPMLAAAIANAALGQLTSLSVSLYYATAPTSAVSTVSGVSYSRVLLGSLSMSLG